MIHLGDITKISGHTAPIVDCIIGGSPCQDLSVAGKRAGLDGERSGLYIEQVRIVKEMREQDERNGRTGVDIRPRYMVWENVPGAFSSNKGEDFRIVLEELAKVKDKDAVIPLPNEGKWTNYGCIMGDGWSIAWRVLDAQFWGVPQRRRRIALIADFGGESAPEILFVRKSVSGNIDESQPKRKEASSDATGGIGTDDRNGVGLDLYNFAVSGDKAVTLNSNSCITNSRIGPFVMCFEPGIASREGGHIYEGVSGTLRANAGDNQIATVYSVNHQGGNVEQIIEGKTGTLTASMNSSGNNKLSICYSIDQGGGKSACNVSEEQSPTLTCTHGGEPVVCYGVVTKGNGDTFISEERHTALTTGGGQAGQGYPCVCYEINCDKAALPAKTRHIVRRLTPLECERLQGYPDGWTDIGEWTDTNGKKRQTSDAARYKALGNSIALPPWKWVLKRLCACYERDATMASLFDGIGGFPYLWEQLNGKGTCLWASEIEEFPIAVTKVRIGGDT